MSQPVSEWRRGNESGLSPMSESPFTVCQILVILHWNPSCCFMYTILFTKCLKFASRMMKTSVSLDSTMTWPALECNILNIIRVSASVWSDFSASTFRLAEEQRTSARLWYAPETTIVLFFWWVMYEGLSYHILQLGFVLVNCKILIELIVVWQTNISRYSSWNWSSYVFFSCAPL